MLESAVHLALADLKQIMRRREIWLWTFVLPVVFFYFVGTITSGYSGDNAKDVIVFVAPPDAGFLADHLAVHIEKAGYSVVKMYEAEAAARDRVLTVPAGFTASLINRKPVKLSFRYRDTGQGGDNDQVRLQKAIYTLIADMVVVRLRGSAVDDAGLVELDSEPRTLELVTQAAGKRKVIPSGFEQAVPGTMVFFLLLVLLTSGGAMLLAEREQGILRRLASAPISRGGVVLAKWMARMLMAAIQIAFCMITGTLVFHVHWGSEIPMIFLVLFTYASMAAAAGLLLGSIARSRPQVGALGSIASNMLAAIGGCWWPAEIMPRSVQAISRFTPPGMAMDALHQLVNFGSSAAAVVPHVIGLACYALVAGFFAAKVFRFQ